jgi:GxxExxY protein
MNRDNAPQRHRGTEEKRSNGFAASLCLRVSVVQMKGNMNHGDTEAQRKHLNELSGKVIGACIEIHRELGPGLLESAYEECLAYELSKAGLRFERQRALPVRYKEVQLDCGYRLDLVIEGLLIVELKAVTELHPIHEAQLLTYLKVDKKSLGLLINFNVPTLKQGVKRVACGDLLKDETCGKSFAFRLLSFLCASVPLWFK